MIVPYIVESDDFDWKYTRLNPTGRWKYVSGPYYKDRIYVEHKGLFGIRRWISETYIEFAEEVSEEVFNCNKRRRG